MTLLDQRPSRNPCAKFNPPNDHASEALNSPATYHASDAIDTREDHALSNYDLNLLNNSSPSTPTAPKTASHDPANEPLQERGLLCTYVVCVVGLDLCMVVFGYAVSGRVAMILHRRKRRR